MKYRFIAVAALLSLALTGCLDEHTPKSEDIKHITCVDPSDPDADKYFFADAEHECVKEKTSFVYSDSIYCCKRPPKCSDHGFYQSVGEGAGARACTAEETKVSNEAGVQTKVVLETGEVCCYHPTCKNRYGFNYKESDNGGKAACSEQSISDAAALNQPVSFTLATGETCCFTSELKPIDGPNCDSGWITASVSEESKCKMNFTDDDLANYTALAKVEAGEGGNDPDQPTGDEDENGENADDDDTDTGDWFYCKPGRIDKRKCRYVPEENQNSRVTYQSGQICSTEQLNPPSDSLRIHVMDIGQGDSMWIQTPDGKNVLIDGGDGAGPKTQSGPIIKDYLITHGFPEDGAFDAVFLTHPHSDHFGGFINLFSTANKFKIKNYIDPMDIGTAEVDSSNYKNWITRVKTLTQADHIYMPAEEKFTVGGSFPADFFGPNVQTEYLFSSKKIGGNPNAASLIFRLTYSGISMLFTGDAEEAQENKAVATGKVEANFLKVCHHGSDTSSSPSFLKAIWNNIDRPKRGAFISSGRYVFSGSYIPREKILGRLLEYVDENKLFSTSAGDDWKHESQSYRDDNVLIVIKKDGSYYHCYSGTN